jgi:isoleucyl-tRNA synthetase
MYQNLVRGVYDDARESVHHTDWPEADESIIDQSLLEQMALARRMTSLGLAARSNANLRVRQPLSKLYVHVAEGRADLTPELLEIVRDELNVKAIEFVSDPEKLVSYRILPNNRLLGPKFGKRFPKVRAALTALPPEEVLAKVNAGEEIMLTVEGETVALSPDEVLVQTLPAEGLAVAADKVITVGVDTWITPELKAEGLAREVVRRIQNMRKNADFDIADHIITWWQTDDEELFQVMETWGDYIRAETLTDELLPLAPPEDAHVETHKIDGKAITLGVKRA